MSTKGQQHLLNTASMSSAREMRKLRRDREVERLRLQRKTKTTVCYPETQSIGFPPEFHFPDESRDWTVLVGCCPMCGWSGQQTLEVRYEKDLSLLRAKNSYRVRCRNPDCFHATDWFPNSQKAIQNWKVIQALHK